MFPCSETPYRNSGKSHEVLAESGPGASRAYGLAEEWYYGKS